MSKNRKNLPGNGLRTAGLLLTISLSTLQPLAHADGILRNGIGARSMSMGGADVAFAEDPLGAMGTDPAALGFFKESQANLGFLGGVLNGEFTKAPTSNGHLDSGFNGLPEAAIAIPLGKAPVTFGASVIPESLLDAKWRYVDPPGGLGGKTSYGLQTDLSKILNLRSAVGLGGTIGDKLALGASVGIDYNENELITPFIFQSAPKVKGAKVLLDLSTSGVGVNGQFGIMYKIMTNLSLAVSYESPTK